MKSIWLVAKNTLKEILRDRILYGLVILGLFLIMSSLLLGELSFAEQGRIVTNMGLVAAEISCSLLAIFIGSSLVYKEIERQTILTILSKPVTRTQFLLGKVLGLTLVIVLVDILISGFLALICSQYGTVHWTQFVWTQTGVMFESFLTLLVALFFGVFCKPTLGAVYTFSFWIIAHIMSDFNYFVQKNSNPIVTFVGSALYRAIPNFQKFQFKEAVIYGDLLEYVHLKSMFFTTLGWSILLLALTDRIFRTRDFT